MNPYPFERLTRIAELCEERTAKFLADLASEPSKVECPKHLGIDAVLNEEASLKEGKAVYRCVECVREAKIRAAKRKLEAAGIPADVRHATVANFQVLRPGVKTGEGYKSPMEFLKATLAFSEGKTRNLFLCGTCGIGKGHLAGIVSIERIASGRSVRWIDCAALFDLYHRAYKTDTTMDVIGAHAACDLLVLDEICLRDLPADGEEVLFAVLDKRHKAGRQTLLLGNATAENVRRWLGSRIVDRLRSGGVVFCFGDWQSMRGQSGDGASEF